MAKSSFCKIIGCPHQTYYYLRGFRCVYRLYDKKPIPTIACIYFDSKGRATPVEIFLESGRKKVSEFQIVAALAKSESIKPR